MTVRAHWSVESVSPLHVASGRSLGGATETLPYIPGTAVRGALAAAFLAAYDDAAPGFQSLTADTRFGNVYPALTASQTPSIPLPLSSVTCSRLPGFLADGGHGIADLLLPAEAALLASEMALIPGEAPSTGQPRHGDLDALVQCRRCPDDARRLSVPGTIPIRGFCAQDNGVPHLASVRYGVSVERQAAGRERPGQQAITVRQTLHAGQRFIGVVTFPDDDTADLTTQLLKLQDYRLWVGAGRSRGLGAIEVAPAGLPPAVEDLAQRQEALMAALQERCRRTGAELPNDQHYVTLTLRSAALVPDSFGRWQQTFSADTLVEWTGLPAYAWQVRQAFVAGTTIEGWNTALGLPKPDVAAIAAGSCWLVRVQGVSGEELFAALQRLEDDGIGERRQEGFGVVSACDRLHWQEQELEGEQQA